MMWSEQIRDIENRLSSMEQKIQRIEAKLDQLIFVFRPLGNGKFAPLSYFFAGATASILGILFMIHNIINALKGG